MQFREIENASNFISTNTQRIRHFPSRCFTREWWISTNIFSSIRNKKGNSPDIPTVMSWITYTGSEDLFLRCMAEVYAPHTIQHSPWWCLQEMRRINFQLSAWRCKFPVFHVTFWIDKMIVCSLRIKKCFENYYQIKKIYKKLMILRVCDKFHVQ